MFNIKEIKGLPTTAFFIIQPPGFRELEPMDDPDEEAGLFVSVDFESKQECALVFALHDAEPLTQEKVLSYLNLKEEDINPNLTFKPLNLNFELSYYATSDYLGELTEGNKGMDVEFASTDHTYGAPHYVLDALTYLFGYYQEDGVTMYGEADFNTGNLVVEDIYKLEDVGLVKWNFIDTTPESFGEDEEELSLYNASMNYINKRQAAAK